MTARDCLFIYLCIFILLTFLLPSHGSVQFSSVRFGSRTVFALSLHSHSSFLSFLIFVLLTSAQTLCFVVFSVYICFDLIVSPRLRNARASKRVQAIHFLSFYIYMYCICIHFFLQFIFYSIRDVCHLSDSLLLYTHTFRIMLLEMCAHALLRLHARTHTHIERHIQDSFVIKLYLLSTFVSSIGTESTL